MKRIIGYKRINSEVDMKKLKVGVIGTGHLGKLHTKMFKSIENCELIGIYDSNPEQAKAVSVEFNVQSASSIEEFIEKS